MILLEEKEITQAHEGEKCRDCGVSIAKAQAKKIYEWGKETCPHWKEQPCWKHTCLLCWQELLKDIG